MKKVSIVVPLYKSEKFLDKLLTSIIGQTYTNLEVILVDDGSPDNSGAIADGYGKEEPRVTVIHKENGGTCEARNVGLALATGEYLMFVDGDDWLEPDCVEYLVRILEENDAEMSMTDSIFTTRDRIQNDEDNIRVWDNKQAVAGIINTFIIPVGPWNKLYSMSSIRKNNISFSVAWFGEGLYFSTMAAMYANKVAVGHRKVYSYRLNNANSGCTLRNPQNAINSLNNIVYIKEHLTIDSPEIQEALNWHIWTNNFNLILYIVSESSKDSYSSEYTNARLELKRLMPYAVRHHLLSAKSKIMIVLKSIFPEAMAKYSIRKADRALKKDLME